MFKNQRIIVIVTTIIVTIVSALAYDLYKKYNPSDEEVFQERLYDLASENETEQVPSNFLQIANLYDEGRSNRVAFDKKYDDKLIEFEGAISEISNDHGCARLKFKVNDENDQYIGYAECSNCPANEDKWSDEIAQLQIGQTVRVRGYYSGSLSSSDNISFYKCHILK